MHQSLERGVRSLFAPDTHGNRPSNFGYCKRHGTARHDARHQSSEGSGRQPAAPRLNPVTVQCRAGQVIRPIRQLRKQKRSSVKHAVTAARARVCVIVCTYIYTCVLPGSLRSPVRCAAAHQTNPAHTARRASGAAGPDRAYCRKRHSYLNFPMSVPSLAWQSGRSFSIKMAQKRRFPHR